MARKKQRPPYSWASMITLEMSKEEYYDYSVSYLLALLIFEHDLTPEEAMSYVLTLPIDHPYPH